MLELFGRAERYLAEDGMELTATATITRIGDEYFLPIDEALLKALECKAGDEVQFTVEGNRLIITRHCEE